MHGMRDLENSHRDYGITGLSENFGSDDGIEEPYQTCWQFRSRIITLASMLPVSERSRQTFAWRAHARNEPTSEKKEIAIAISL